MIWESLIAPITSIIDKIIPDPKVAQEAKFNLLKLQQDGTLKEAEIQLSAILTEAQSQDKWTSRARPSFLYVIYIMILSAIPMGILHAFNPNLASSIAEGMKLWLQAIPDALWTLFGAGYLGYSFSRSFDKAKGAKT